MEVVLVIIVIVLFAVIAVVTLKGRGARRTAREQDQAEAGDRAGLAQAQHDRSLARQADVKAAHAEDASRAGSGTDE